MKPFFLGGGMVVQLYTPLFCFLFFLKKANMGSSFGCRCGAFDPARLILLRRKRWERWQELPGLHLKMLGMLERPVGFALLMHQEVA